MEVLLDPHIIDTENAVPYYYQLKQYLARKIQSGDWAAGQKLPSEKQFCQRLGVSRIVVRQALTELAAEGLIDTYRAKGSFVAQNKHEWHLMQSMGGFFHDARRNGMHVTAQIRELKIIPATGEVGENLMLSASQNVIRLERLRFISGEPVALCTAHIPAHLCPDLVNEDLREASLYETLSTKYGLVIASGLRTIESVRSDPEKARLLGTKPGNALSKITSVAYLKDGTPLEYFISWHRGDKSRFEARLVNTG